MIRAWVALLLLAGCGARTGLEQREVAVAPPCEPAPETCNARDDDCDGNTDEALGFGPVAGPFEVVDDRAGYFTNDLVAVQDGFVSVWNTGFDGSHPPHTNAFARLLDHDGRPLGDAHAILERPVTMGLTGAASPRGVLLTYCGRFGFEDRPATAFLDGRGGPLGGEVMRGDGTRSCGAVVQGGVWTGRAHLFSWITNGGVSDGTYPVFLDVADAEGHAIGERQVEVHGDLYTAPTFAMSNGVVGLAYGARPEIRRSAIDVVRLAADGSAIGTPIRIGEAPVEERAYGSAVIAPDLGGGWVVMASNSNGPGLFAARIDRTGVVTMPLTEIESSGRRFDDLDLGARPGGDFVVVANAYLGPESTLYAATLDRALQITATWEPGVTLAYVYVPTLETTTGRIFLQGSDPESTRLVTRELGCVP